MIRMLASFYSDDPGLNRAEMYHFSSNSLFQNEKGANKKHLLLSEVDFG